MWSAAMISGPAISRTAIFRAAIAGAAVTRTATVRATIGVVFVRSRRTVEREGTRRRSRGPVVQAMLPRTGPAGKLMAAVLARRALMLAAAKMFFAVRVIAMGEFRMVAEVLAAVERGRAVVTFGTGEVMAWSPVPRSAVRSVMALVASSEVMTMVAVAFAHGAVMAMSAVMPVEAVLCIAAMMTVAVVAVVPVTMMPVSAMMSMVGKAAVVPVSAMMSVSAVVAVSAMVALFAVVPVAVMAGGEVMAVMPAMVAVFAVVTAMLGKVPAMMGKARVVAVVVTVAASMAVTSGAGVAVMPMMAGGKVMPVVARTAMAEFMPALWTPVTLGFSVVGEMAVAAVALGMLAVFTFFARGAFRPAVREMMMAVMSLVLAGGRFAVLGVAFLAARAIGVCSLQRRCL